MDKPLSYKEEIDSAALSSKITENYTFNLTMSQRKGSYYGSE